MVKIYLALCASLLGFNVADDNLRTWVTATSFARPWNSRYSHAPYDIPRPRASILNRNRVPQAVWDFSPKAQLATCVSYWRYQRFLVLDYTTREALSLSALSYPLAVCGLVWISPHYSHASHGVRQLGLSGPPVVLEGG